MFPISRSIGAICCMLAAGIQLCFSKQQLVLTRETCLAEQECWYVETNPVIAKFSFQYFFPRKTSQNFFFALLKEALSRNHSERIVEVHLNATQCIQRGKEITSWDLPKHPYNSHLPPGYTCCTNNTSKQWVTFLSNINNHSANSKPFWRPDLKTSQAPNQYKQINARIKHSSCVACFLTRVTFSSKFRKLYLWCYKRVTSPCSTFAFSYTDALLRGFFLKKEGRGRV